MYAPQEACGVVFNAKAIVPCRGFAFWLWLLRLALRLKLAQALQHALLLRRRCLFYFGGFSFFPDLAFPLGKLPVVVLYHGLCLAVSRHERPYIGIAVLF